MKSSPVSPRPWFQPWTKASSILVGVKGNRISSLQGQTLKPLTSLRPDRFAVPIGVKPISAKPLQLFLHPVNLCITHPLGLADLIGMPNRQLVIIKRP
jgi:hypothetical protein